MKSIKPKSMNIREYRSIILKQLRLEGIQLKKELLRPTKTWKKRVSFKKTLRTVKLSTILRVSTSDKRYRFLNDGTQIRWAIMSPNFQPKSQVRSLVARRGRGGAVIRGRTAMTKRNIRPIKPGIKARHFTGEVVKKRRPVFFFNMRRAMKRAAKGTF